MSNKAKVTVVIPNYNGLKFMDPCFKALNLQLCRDFDILVVDNGSTDGTGGCVRRQGPRRGQGADTHPAEFPVRTGTVHPR